MTQKLERVFQVLLLLLLPSQLALHFWPSWSLISGIRVDYLSPTLYFTDLIILGLFLSSRLRVRVPGAVIIFAVLNILISSSPLVSLYKWFHVLEYFWLFKYLVKKNLALSTWPLALAVIWTSALAWWQFFLQHSVGGLWWWLGERPLSVATPLIAKAALRFGTWDLGLILRPYATLPHPNALAGFLLVAGLIIYSFKSKLRVGRWALWAAALTIPLTFSRTVIIMEVLILIIGIYLKTVNWKLKIAGATLLLVSSLYFLVSISGSAGSFSDRFSLILNTLYIIQKFPFLGVGLGGFIPATGLYQPVHNIYLLLTSELGLPAAAVISYWLLVHGKRLLRTMNYELIAAVAVIAITGAVDHYWFTLHQNTLLLVVLLAIMKVKSMNHEQ